MRPFIQKKQNIKHDFFNSFLTVIISAFALFACRSNSQMDTTINEDLVSVDIKDLKTIEIPSSLANNTRSIDFTQLIDNISFVELETNNDALIGEVYNILFDDDKIFVTDQNSSEGVFIFDKTGKLLAKINSKGEGPEEFSKINDVSLDTTRNQIIILDLQIPRLLTYDYTGKFIESKKLPFFFQEFMVFPNQTLAMKIISNKGVRNPIEIQNFLYATASLNDNKILNRGLYLKTDDASFPVNWELSFRNGFNGINYLPNFYDTLYSVSETGLKALFAFTFDKNRFSIRESYKLDQNNLITKLKTSNSISGNYVHLKDYLLFSAIFSNNTEHNLLYDKAKQTINKISLSNVIPESLFISNQNFYYSSNTFVTPVSVLNIKNTFESLKYKKLEEFQHKSEFDNPILVFYTLKSNNN